MRTCCFLFLLLSLNACLRAEQLLSDRLQQDLDAGRITRAQYLAFQLMAAEDPRLLPHSYQGSDLTGLPCPTLVAAEARALLPDLSAEGRTLLMPLLDRPSADRLPLSMVSPKGYFRIHYTTQGYDSTSVAFVQEAGRSFDYVYDLLVHEMGYSPPPADGNIDGAELDIYIMRFSAYGETRYENPVDDVDDRRYTSYIVIDSKFSGSGFATQGVDALHVTAAHEFFHMLQGGYRFFPSTTMDSRFLFEASSTWFEDVAYGEVNDYLQYVRTLFASPNRPFHVFSSTTYGLGIYMAMLYKIYDFTLIRRIWEELREHEPLDALDKALKSVGSDIGRSLASLSAWNAFTNIHADTLRYYHDGPFFPAITPLKKEILVDKLTISNQATQLETHYYTITIPSGGKYTLTPSLSNPSQWLVTLVTHESGYPSRQYTSAGNTPITFGPVSVDTELHLAIVNIQWPIPGSSQSASAYALYCSTLTSNHEPGRGILKTLPSPFYPEQHERMQIQFYIEEDVSEATLFIFNERGETIHAQTMRDLPRGLNCYFWDGRADSGAPARAGIYLCAIRGIGHYRPHKFALIR